ncbi:alanine racemase [Pusillimonas sp. ANT_WB101]|uniref:alanine racemase n=1 Tax=Pusillimonas sp. ANT_WB101 TaxID=2597356 RepID=UPI0011ED5473|nr:alanine racemase [Pusillimonas sp. ANT_WB101]KAA0888471.1 alanine racemase [Pusillimonas sp. ANT_WB101]
MPRPISATISVPSLIHNLKTVTAQMGRPAVPAGSVTPRVWAVIKARGYGHGIEPAVRAFNRADGLAMLDLEEAVQCRQLGWTGPILLLEGFFEPRDLAVLDEYRLTTTIHTAEQLDMLNAARLSKPIDAFIKLDSGMSRLGFSPARFRDAYARAMGFVDRGLLASVGKMTHFARADDDAQVTRQQLDVFRQATQGLPGAVSVCNSAATLTPGLWAGVGGDDGQWVRPGICLYGASPFADRSAAQLGLRPAMTLASRLISVRTVAAGAGVGYGHVFIASKNTRIGIVACGYADGYPRHAVTGTPVTVDGVRTRLLGRVSMDMLAVDLDPVLHAQVGAPVVLWGEGGPSIDEVATAAGTIGYELMCAVAPRVPKVILEEKQT